MPSETKRLLERRFLFITVWRPIGDTVRDAPLALCGAGSVAPADLMPADLIYKDRTGKIYYATYNARHRGLYVPRMRPHEMILLKNYDSAGDGRARLAPHAAFLDPTAPPQARDRLFRRVTGLQKLGL